MDDYWHELEITKPHAKKAGGKVTDLYGNNQRYDTNTKGAMVSNGAFHAELQSVIKGINYSRNTLLVLYQED